MELHSLRFIWPFSVRKSSPRVRYHYNEFSIIQQISSIKKTSLRLSSLDRMIPTYERNIYKMLFYSNRASSDLWFIESSSLINLYISFRHDKSTTYMGHPPFIKMTLFTQCQWDISFKTIYPASMMGYAKLWVMPYLLLGYSLWLVTNG